MKKITLGIVAHVDSGKTTLSEALMYASGKLRSFGRVDKGDSFLDNDALERRRGITIYAKPALFEFGETAFTLLDTPGHADFSAEMERTLQVLDYCLLVVSASDGVTGRTEALWRLLSDYGIPVFIFVNKMDQPGADRAYIMAQLRSQLSDAVVDMTEQELTEMYDHIAMCDEAAMDEFLETGVVSAETICDMVAERRLFPCFFGSALKIDGVSELLGALDAYTLEAEWDGRFGARVFKILNDADGRRLTFMKITGGVLRARDTLPDGAAEAKVNQLRVYSGDRFNAVSEAAAGDVCAVVGLSESYAGQGFGCEEGTIPPVLQPVLSYRVLLSEGTDPVKALPLLRQLEEESPELKVRWEEETRDIFVMVMGAVQLEILKSVAQERFGLEIGFDNGEIIYKETIAVPVIGVGHFEPLRHYAEVHLLMEPLPEGSGLIFESRVSTDVLEINWQRLVLTHLAEREHRGVLTGSAITDMKITLISGRASKKHTSGGDFRQATYRAVRQGLMHAENVLLEPYFRFTLRVGAEHAGRAMTDMERMKAVFGAPDITEGVCILSGRVPAAALADYAQDVAAYTKGEGDLSVVADGYGPCHNAEDVIFARGYDPASDIRNPADSVFCAGGEGYVVPYDKVYDAAHMPVAKVVSRSVAAAQAAPSTGYPEGAAVPKAHTEPDQHTPSYSLQGDYQLIFSSENAHDADPSAGGTDHTGRQLNDLRYSLGTEEVDLIVSRTTGANAGARSSRVGWKKRRKRAGFGAADGSMYASGNAGAGSQSSTRGSQNYMHGSSAGPAGRGISGSNRYAGAGGRDASGSNRYAGGHSAHGSGMFSGASIFPPDQAKYLLVDGYNVIFAWEDLADLARANMDAARISLQEMLCNYQAIHGCEVIVVYDAYRVKGHDTEYSDYMNIHVVFTREAETADQYIEKFAHDHARHERVAVVTSDGLEQIIIRGQGCALISSREFRAMIDS